MSIKFSTAESEGKVMCSSISEAGWLFAVGRSDGFTIYRVLPQTNVMSVASDATEEQRECQGPLAELQISYHVPLLNIRWCHSQPRLRHTCRPPPNRLYRPPPPSPNDIEIKSLADVCDGITHLALYGEYPRLAMVARPRQVSDGLRRRWQGGGYDCMPSATSVLIVRCTDASHAQITHEVTVENDVVSIFLSTNILGVCTSVGWSLYTDPMPSSGIRQAHQEKFDSAHPSTPQHPPPFVFCAKFGLLLTRSPRSACGIALYGITRTQIIPLVDALYVVKYAEEVSALRHYVENATLHVGPQNPHQSQQQCLLEADEPAVIRVAVSSVKRRALHLFLLEPQVTKDILSSKKLLEDRCAVNQDCVVPFTRLLKQYVCSSYVSNPPRLDQLQFVECGSCIAWFDTQRRHVNFLHGVPTSAPQKMLWASVFGMKSQVGLLRMGGPLFGKERLPADAPLFLFAADSVQPRVLRAEFCNQVRTKVPTMVATIVRDVNVLEPLPPPSVVCLNCINCQNGDLLTIREYPHRGEMYASSINKSRVSGTTRKDIFNDGFRMQHPHCQWKSE